MRGGFWEQIQASDLSSIPHESNHNSSFPISPALVSPSEIATNFFDNSVDWARNFSLSGPPLVTAGGICKVCDLKFLNACLHKSLDRRNKFRILLCSRRVFYIVFSLSNCDLLVAHCRVVDCYSAHWARAVFIVICIVLFNVLVTAFVQNVIFVAC
jgi:hypothetical protein